jgi:hypothetical protein
MYEGRGGVTTIMSLCDREGSSQRERMGDNYWYSECAVSGSHDKTEDSAAPPPPPRV